MIRKDLQDLNELKKSSMMSSYGSAYPGAYLGSSNYYTNSLVDYGATGMYSSKSSVSGFPLANNVQQIYTVVT